MAAPATETPFCSIDDAREYLQLLIEAIEYSRQEVAESGRSASRQRDTRREHGLQFAALKLAQLSSHVAKSRQIHNDLRRVRNLLLSDETAARPADREPVSDPSKLPGQRRAPLPQNRLLTTQA